MADKNHQDVDPELAKHRALMNDINALLATVSGRNFVKYLFESFGVGELPQPFTKAEELIERVAFLRTGQSIYKLIANANPLMAATIMAEIEKEKLNENIDTTTET